MAKGDSAAGDHMTKSTNWESETAGMNTETAWTPFKEK